MMSKRVFAGLFVVLFCLTSHGQAQTNLNEQKLTAVDKLFERIINLKHLDVYYILNDLEQQITDEETVENMERVHLALEYAFQSELNAKLEKYAQELERIASAVNDPSHGRLAKVYQAAFRGLEGDFSKSITELESLLTEAQEAHDVLVTFTTYNMLATLAPYREELNIALEYANSASKLLSGAPERALLELQLYNTLAYIYTYLNDDDRTIEFYNRSFDIAEQSGMAIDVGVVLFNVGGALQKSKRYAESTQFLEAMIEFYRQTNQSKNLLYPYHGLARNYFEQDNYEKSMEYIRKASKYTSTSVSFETRLNQLGAVVAARLGQVEEARQYREKVRHFFDKHPGHNVTNGAVMNIKIDAEIARAEGRLADAIELFEKFHKLTMKEVRNAHTSDVMKLRANLETNMRIQKAEQALKQQGNELKLQLLIFASLIIALVISVAFILQRRVAKELIESKALAESANRTKSEFLANMSHELRTPLNAIIGFSDMMKQQIYGKLGSSFYDQYTEMIHSSGHHLLNIINEILDISKVESGSFELNENYCDVERMIAAAIKLIEAKTNDMDVAITYNVPKDFPELYADPRIVNQILYNALSNAVKFNRPGGRVEVTAFVDPENKDICIRVTDDGVGMTKDEIEHVLKPFAQVQNPMTRTHEGTGLGLPLMSAFMNLHGGKLDIKSEKGRGTKITLIFPHDRAVLNG